MSISFWNFVLCRVLQETEKNARRQFKGLFDKKPGELSEFNEVETKVEEKAINSSEIDQDETVDPSSASDESEDNISPPSKNNEESMSNLWIKCRKWFNNFPSRRCTIVWSLNSCRFYKALLHLNLHYDKCSSSWSRILLCIKNESNQSTIETIVHTRD